jgi:hypothetical protein
VSRHAPRWVRKLGQHAYEWRQSARIYVDPELRRELTKPVPEPSCDVELEQVRSDIEAPPTLRCSRHDEPMYPITWAGDPSDDDTGMWQCRSCAEEFCAVLDEQENR